MKLLRLQIEPECQPAATSKYLPNHYRRDVRCCSRQETIIECVVFSFAVKHARYIGCVPYALLPGPFTESPQRLS